MNPFANPELPVLGVGMGVDRSSRGVPVETIFPRSPAAAAGLRVGDVIQKLDGEDIRDGSELMQVLAKRQAGDSVKIGISREGKPLDFDIILARREALYEER